jgi:hypothetical protein
MFNNKIYTMKKNLNSVFTGLLFSLMIIVPSTAKGQNEKIIIKKYLTKLPIGPVSNALQKYRMTAVYTNRDLYGTFTGKTKVTGDYTRGLGNGFVTWNNIFISASNNFSEPFQTGKNQEYMENMKYIPSEKMLQPDAFMNFPANPESVFAKNLVWDMMAIEMFAWDYSDSLKPGKIYYIPDIKGEFKMADIGSYTHSAIQVCWTGISAINDELCAVIDFRALDNKIEMTMDALNTKGTEQYWGTVYLSLKNRLIESAVMYGGTIQEIKIKGMENKFLVKTIRELWVDKIQ